ncbi:hypothetical protein DRE_02598 [Drechslerella stenobrocha 248]|uniref:18S rRNA biogenesis protein RCL1 n=1 Tax=Drechslerella stenobrocha 248 TaxID=1043628 RepID=W7HWU8_9PEZI|nr:hypothetical protein DRE_02598 [Drechslerella stenobrocha 248]
MSSKQALSNAPQALAFTTSASLRHRLVQATLTGKPIKITSIRPTSLTPGLLPHEVSFLRLLDSLTNGGVFQISETGTTLLYKPGLIGHTPSPNSATSSASKIIKHEISAESSARGVTYFLEPACILAPFSKSPFHVVFCGPGCVTSATDSDYSVDTFRTAILPLYAHFNIIAKLECRITKRSCSPGGGGEVNLTFGHQIRLPPTLHLRNPGRVKRIRGVSYTIGVSAGNSQRMIHSAREVLNRFINDIYIYSEVVARAPSAQGGKRGTPGFGMSLVATSSTDCIYSADWGSNPDVIRTPEEVGRGCALRLLEEIAKGGCVQRIGVKTMVSLMMMGSEDVGRVVLGRGVVDEDFVGHLRDWKAFGCGEVLVKEWSGSEGLAGGGLGGMDAGQLISLGVVGKGVGNVGRKVA